MIPVALLFATWRFACVADVDLGPAAKRDCVPAMADKAPSWAPDSSGFYYAASFRRTPAAEWRRAIGYHKLGTNGSDDPVLFDPPHKARRLKVDLSVGGRYLLVTVDRFSGGVAV